MKYRLKQWYPSLPSRWKGHDIIVTNTYCDNPPKSEYARPEEFHKGHWRGLPKKEVENNPDYWKPIEEPLFTTEDGVDIYEDDWYYYVTEKYQIGKRQCPYYSHSDNFIATFSTKEKAQEYIDKHKLKYSKADINDALEKSKYEMGKNVNVHMPRFRHELGL